MSDPSSVSQEDLGDFVHRVSLPSLSSLNLPQDDTAAPSPRHAANGTPNSHSAVSLTSTDLEVPTRRQTPSQRRKKQARANHALPPRTSSRKKSRFSGFEGAFDHPRTPGSAVGLSPPTPAWGTQRPGGPDLVVTPVRRMNAYSHSNDRARLSPMHARRRPHSDGIFTLADTAERTVPLISGRPSSMVEQVRELAKEARRQARLESGSLTRGHFETPQSYRDDTDDHTLIAAPAPSVSPNALGTRIDYIQPPSRSISRLDQYECEELSFSGQIYVLSHLTFFSILGTAARIGLDRLVSYPGAPSVIPVLWPNFAGSFLLGLVLEERNLSAESQDPDGPSNTLEKARLVHLQSNMNMPLSLWALLLAFAAVLIPTRLLCLMLFSPLRTASQRRSIIHIRPTRSCRTHFQPYIETPATPWLPFWQYLYSTYAYLSRL